MFSALSLLVGVIQILRRCSARAVLLLHASTTPRMRGVISLPPIGSRYRHSAADLMLMTCAASAAQWHVSTDPAQKMCAATAVRQRPATFFQQISWKGCLNLWQGGFHSTSGKFGLSARVWSAREKQKKTSMPLRTILSLWGDHHTQGCGHPLRLCGPPHRLTKRAQSVTMTLGHVHFHVDTRVGSRCLGVVVDRPSLNRCPKNQTPSSVTRLAVGVDRALTEQRPPLFARTGRLAGKTADGRRCALRRPGGPAAPGTTSPRRGRFPVPSQSADSDGQAPTRLHGSWGSTGGAATRRVPARPGR